MPAPEARQLAVVLRESRQKTAQTCFSSESSLSLYSRSRLYVAAHADMRLPHFLLFFLATLAPVVLASSGDIAPPFIDCLSTCNKQLCRPNSPLPLTFTLKLTRWTCVDDCKYRCMHMITDVAVKHHAPIQQYYGKWPFWRFAGMQEPASVLFSIFNFLAHLQGWKKIRQRVPDGHPMKTYYLAFALASMNAWVWSSVFHTRGPPLLLSVSPGRRAR